MKKICNYISMFILLLLAVTGCKDNDNWTIIEEAQPGTYVVGSATIFSGEASTSALKPVKLDLGDGLSETKPEIIGIYTWLKAGGEFNISVCKAVGEEPVHYGKGEVVEEVPDVISICNLSAGGPAFTVASDGLYNIIVNTSLNQVSILPVSWGIIGAATEGAWDKETPFNAPKFDATSTTVEWEMSTTLNAGEFKFRYSGNWGYEIPYDAASKVKIFTDVTGTKEGTDNVLTEGFSSMETGGANLVTNIGGQFSVFMKYDIRAGQFSARYVLTGDPVVPPAYPENLFIVGDAFQGWTPETDAEECIPVNGTPSSFWKIAYLNPGGFKFTVKLGWGGDFGIAEENTDAIGEYTKGGNNINVTTPGYYLIYVNLEDNTVSVTDVNIYLFGDVNGGDPWEYAEVNKFTVDNAAKKITSPAFAADGNLRMCIKHPGLPDWWRAEFNIYEGKIEYRGNGGDQPAVGVKAGQKAVLDFTDGTGVIQ